MQETFKNKLAVHKWLKDDGWKISQRGFYNHCRDGLVRQEKDGTYTLRAVMKYAKAHLVRADTGKKVGEESDELARKKQKVDIDLKEEHRLMARLKRKEAEGKLIPRDDVERELVSRAIVFDAGLRNKFQSKAAEWVALVGGKQSHIRELVDALNEALDDQMNEYANLKEFTAALEV